LRVFQYDQTNRTHAHSPFAVHTRYTLTGEETWRRVQPSNNSGFATYKGGVSNKAHDTSVNPVFSSSASAIAAKTSSYSPSKIREPNSSHVASTAATPLATTTSSAHADVQHAPPPPSWPPTAGDDAAYSPPSPLYAQPDDGGVEVSAKATVYVPQHPSPPATGGDPYPSLPLYAQPTDDDDDADGDAVRARVGTTVYKTIATTTSSSSDSAEAQQYPPGAPLSTSGDAYPSMPLYVEARDDDDDDDGYEVVSAPNERTTVYKTSQKLPVYVHTVACLPTSSPATRRRVAPMHSLPSPL
jgi:hypothetical protein